MIRSLLFMTAALVAATSFVAPSFAAKGPPLASTWNIAPTGAAASSGDLEFRITTADGSDPVDITVPVIAGASEDSLARSIRRVLGSQLPRDRYTVQLGEGTNVLVSDPRGRPNFSVELIASDIDNVRVAVQSVTPSAPPTVPAQAEPSEAPALAPPADTVPGNAVPPPSRVPAGTPPGEVSPPPAVPPPASVPAPSPRGAPPPSSIPAPADFPAPSPAAPPPNATGGSGAPASAPPPGS